MKFSLPRHRPAAGWTLQGLSELLFHEQARPLRFAVTGGIAALMQLSLLSGLIHGGTQPILANGLAFLVAAQVNFCLSQLFTWHDRTPGAWTRRELVRRWLLFHGSITGAAVLNMLVFVLAHHAMPAVAASALGILVASVVNFAAHDRLAFGRVSS